MPGKCGIAVAMLIAERRWTVAHVVNEAATCPDVCVSLQREIARLELLVRQHSLDIREWQAVVSTVRDLIRQLREAPAIADNADPDRCEELNRDEVLVLSFERSLRSFAFCNDDLGQQEVAG